MKSWFLLHCLNFDWINGCDIIIKIYSNKNKGKIRKPKVEKIRNPQLLISWFSLPVFFLVLLQFCSNGLYGLHGLHKKKIYNLRILVFSIKKNSASPFNYFDTILFIWIHFMAKSVFFIINFFMEFFLPFSLSHFVLLMFTESKQSKISS